MQGQRKIVLGMPAFDNNCHIGTPCRRFTTRGCASIFFGRSKRVNATSGR